MKLVTLTDGGSRGNPGPAAIGVVIKNTAGHIVAGYGEYIGHATNNVAEYSALISALKKALALGATEVECKMDSMLVAEQMNRHWKVKNAHIQKLFIEAWNAAAVFKKISFKHIRREYNTEPDAWVNKALDARK